MHRITPIILALTLLSLSSCGKKSNIQPQVQPILVEVMTIAAQKQVNTHSYVGRIEQQASIPISTSNSGVVTQLYVTNGDEVVAGQALLTIDTTQAFNSLQIAQATLQQAQDGYQRAQQVYEHGGVTPQKMVELQSQLQQAQSALAIARKHLDDCTIKAPRNGVVAECHIQIGQQITPAAHVLTLLDMQNYKVSFDVPEKDISAIRIGDKGTLSIEVLNLAGIPIRIDEKNLIANRLSHTYAITATLQTTSHIKRQLLPGLVGKVILQAQTVEGIILPATCIHTQSHGTVIWVVEDGKATRRSIDVGSYTADGVLITRGLSTGDIVITSGHQKMYNGAPVTY